MNHMDTMDMVDMGMDMVDMGKDMVDTVAMGKDMLKMALITCKYHLAQLL